MIEPTLLTQLLQKIKLASGFSLTTLQSHQPYKMGLNYQAIQKKDILTLDEAAFYVGIDPDTLVEEVKLGHIPGGQLAKKWLFYRWALTQQFAGYQQPDNFEDDDIFENFLGEIPKSCDAKAVSKLLDEYALGERNFSGIDLSGAVIKGVSLIKRHDNRRVTTAISPVTCIDR